MSNHCPLPIDWLDFVETGGPDSLSTHLESCPSCQRLVTSLRDEAKDDDLGDWLSGVELGNAVVWRPQPARSPSFGQLVLNAARYVADDAEYDQLPRLLFLTLDEGREIDGRRWLRVAPADTDVENASSTDLILNAEETDVGVPLRILFSLETSIAIEQIYEQVGALTSTGSDVVRQALAGDLDDMRFGLPLEGPDDERLAIDRETEEVVRILRTPFFAAGLGEAVQETEAIWPETEHDSAEPGRLILFDFSLVRAKGEQLALAAKTEANDLVGVATLRSDLGDMEGRLHYEFMRDMLLFVIDRVEGFSTSEITLVLHTKESEEVESAPFVPHLGEEIEVGPVFLLNIEDVAARVG